MKEKNGMQSISELFASRLPTLIWVSIVYAGTVILQFLKEPLILEGAVFTGLFTVHVLLHWNSYRVTQKTFWIYFSVQAALVYLCAILMRDGYQAVLIGLLPILIAQSLGYSFRLKRVVFISIISIIVFFDSALTVKDTDELIVFLPIFILMLIVVLAYAILFFKQVQERMRIQSFLEDLRKAHEKVEELTLANERQRMARDLHDTLAQGVAGLIMRLEAADAHMSQNHMERAHEIIGQSMQQARRTLAEARRAIDNLRLKSAPEIDFKEAIADEIEHFNEATGIIVSKNYRFNRTLSRLQMEHSLHIVKECLTNIARHAKADKVCVSVSSYNDRLVVEIRDNGIGFRTEDIGKDAGHYGLLGLKERVRLIGGEIDMSSTPEGTTIIFEAPLAKGELT
ncbi:sensor histidine kinase [Paenibacillus sp. MMS20-IR301]|uniref:sensor histidine kinase n=1 Tax=Paenibacillus sp. MMS20-IR301 TaxID=2895946 RepID=UPI0028E525D7|nr:sensor histidine kinase [Paenibacillus sp. MMS20-IR301]WNS40801.1 sensor histidine kinase [Paenibacillus sp. MMS20-IR301]